MIDTTNWTVRCAGCGLVRPWARRNEHQCPNPVRLEDALEVLTEASTKEQP